jgi:hypothetical protein
MTWVADRRSAALIGTGRHPVPAPVPGLGFRPPGDVSPEELLLGQAALADVMPARPTDTILVLISDLYEGGIAEEMLRRAAAIVGSGATLIALLALSDSGHPSFDSNHAAALAGIGVPAFTCTPDLFPDLISAAIERRDVSGWAATNDIATSHTS